MSILGCSECSHWVSSRDEFCPNCGTPNPLADKSVSVAVATAISVAACTARGAVGDGAGSIFSSLACPYCSADLWPPPRHSGTKCRWCLQKVDIDRTADGLCSLVGFGKGVAEQQWAEYQAARTASLEHHPEPLKRLNRTWLRRYADLGLEVRVEVNGEGCPSCRKLAQQVYAASYPPVLPNPSCSNRICCCEYRPVMPAK
jgi:hypothetical protein